MSGSGRLRIFQRSGGRGVGRVL